MLLSVIILFITVLMLMVEVFTVLTPIRFWKMLLLVVILRKVMIPMVMESTLQIQTQYYSMLISPEIILIHLVVLVVVFCVIPPKFIDVIITGNQAHYGGGIKCDSNSNRL